MKDSDRNQYGGVSQSLPKCHSRRAIKQENQCERWASLQNAYNYYKRVARRRRAKPRRVTRQSRRGRAALRSSNKWQRITLCPAPPPPAARGLLFAALKLDTASSWLLWPWRRSRLAPPAKHQLFMHSHSGVRLPHCFACYTLLWLAG